MKVSNLYLDIGLCEKCMILRFNVMLAYMNIDMQSIHKTITMVQFEFRTFSTSQLWKLIYQIKWHHCFNLMCNVGTKFSNTTKSLVENIIIMNSIVVVFVKWNYDEKLYFHKWIYCSLRLTHIQWVSSKLSSAKALLLPLPSIFLQLKKKQLNLKVSNFTVATITNFYLTCIWEWHYLLFNFRQYKLSVLLR